MSDTNPKKILYLITKSNWGGAQKYVYELALEAKNRGHSVAVACGGTGTKRAKLGRMATKLKGDQILVIPIKHFMRDISLWQEIMAFFEVLKLLFEERPDILHVTSSKAGGLGAVAGRLTGIKKIVFTSHGLTMDETWRPNWQISLISYFTWLTVVLSHHTIMISTETFDRIRKLPFLAKKVSLIFNGLSPYTLFHQAQARDVLLQDEVLPDDVVLIGGNGELHPNKNWASLIWALTKLPDNVRLLIIGEGEEREELESLINELELKNKVYLTGYVDDVAKYYKAFDIFILPSKKEGLPYVLLEAGFAKLPTVASDLPGIRDIIINDENGLLVAPKPTPLANTIGKLIKDKDKQTKLAASLNKTIKNKFAIEEMLGKTFAVYAPSTSTSDC